MAFEGATDCANLDNVHLQMPLVVYFAVLPALSLPCQILSTFLSRLHPRASLFSYLGPNSSTDTTSFVGPLINRLKTPLMVTCSEGLALLNAKHPYQAFVSNCSFSIGSEEHPKSAFRVQMGRKLCLKQKKMYMCVGVCYCSCLEI